MHVPLLDVDTPARGGVAEQLLGLLRPAPRCPAGRAGHTAVRGLPATLPGPRAVSRLPLLMRGLGVGTERAGDR